MVHLTQPDGVGLVKLSEVDKRRECIGGIRLYRESDKEEIKLVKVPGCDQEAG